MSQKKVVYQSPNVHCKLYQVWMLCFVHCSVQMITSGRYLDCQSSSKMNLTRCCQCWWFMSKIGMYVPTAKQLSAVVSNINFG